MIAKIMKVHILTADTFGTARDALRDIDCNVNVLTGDNHDVQKEEYVQKLDAESVVLSERQ